KSHRNYQRQFLGLSGSSRRVLFKMNVVNTRLETVTHFQTGGARLGIPTLELGKINPADTLHGSNEIVTGDGLPIKTREVVIRSSTEFFLAQQARLHAHHFRPLLVNGKGVEVVDLLVTGGAHRMRHRSLVFRELVTAQKTH